MKNRNFFYFQILIIILAFYVVSVAFLYRKEIHMDLPDEQTGVILMLLATSFGMLLAIFMRISLTNKISKEKKSDVDIQEEEDAKAKNILNEEERKKEKHSISIEPQKEIIVNILDIQTAFLRIEERLKKELKAIGKRSNINLIIGSVIAVVGWILLVLFIYEINGLEFKG